ncbi:formyltransferase family protein [Blattabacterium cuenoti]|uniref:formyltransferase family protein n=1 Tax=Blattabacterium cuenoti TaxID=1653831 RepID=UPI00163C877F|nr:formyltransferase family protein [Blattabacterium cuenoti]
MEYKAISILVSGKGTNMKHIFQAINKKILSDFIIDSVISDRNCDAIKYAKKRDIKTFSLKKDKFLSKKIDKILKKHFPYVIVLSGFLSILDELFCKKWSGKIINIHPSLLPKYCGIGMYGMKVHKSVINNKEKISGATVHYVTKNIDKGPIILKKSCKISNKETVLSLSKKVSLIEREILIKSIKNL